MCEFSWFHCLFFLQCHLFFVKKNQRGKPEKKVFCLCIFNELYALVRKWFDWMYNIILLNNVFNITILPHHNFFYWWCNSFPFRFFGFIYFHCHRSCIIGPQLEVKVCTLGTVINRTAYPSDYCQLEGTGRQSQPMPIRWMSWESVLLVSHSLWFWFCQRKYYICIFLEYEHVNQKEGEREKNGDELATQFHYFMRHNSMSVCNSIPNHSIENGISIITIMKCPV